MKNYKWFDFVCIVILFCCFTHSVSAMSRQALIIDTDMGNDDVMALLYLLKNPRLDIKLITIETNGDTHCEAAFHNAAGLLRLLHRETIPLACGVEQVVPGGHAFPASVIANEDRLSGAAQWLPSVSLPVSHAAVPLLIKTVIDTKKPVNILALGPLTNIARAYQLHPIIKQNIKHVYIMGGAVHVPGNVDVSAASAKQAEWNIYFDPAAAQVVLAHLSVVLVPLDASNQVPLNEKFLQRLAHDEHTTATDYFYRLLKANEKSMHLGEWFFWDPLAAVVASDERVCEFKWEKLRVSSVGITLQDEKFGALVKVCERVKVEKFTRELLGIIGRC